MSGTTGAKPGLKRVLGLWALVIYGIILVQPTGAMPLYGIICDKAHGHVVTTILIAMVAMLFTAISYGRMANAYPTAGSAYTYVGQELHTSLGYLTGWAMVFDYLLNPIISVMFCSYTARRLLEWASERWPAWEFVQHVPYWAWALFFALLFTGMNLRGIQSSARTNQWLAAGLMAVVVLFLLAAGGYIWADPQPVAGRFLRPFYDPASFDLKDVLGRGRAGDADLYWLRRRLHALRGGAQPASQHPPGHGPDLRNYRRPGRLAGLCRRHGLAQQPIPPSGDRHRGHRGPSRRHRAVHYR